MTTASIQFDVVGANPYLGPLSTTVASGVPQPQFRYGTVVRGDRGSEFIFVQLVLGSTTTLTPGQAYQYDKDFNASLVTTAAGIRGYDCGGCPFYAPATAAGTYGIWLQRAGNGPVASSGIAAGAGETTTTAGLANFASTPTTGAKTLAGLYSYLANQTFTATTVNGSTTLSGMSNAQLNDLQVGATVTGTGIPGSTIITAITASSGANTVTISNAATATGTGVTVTAAGVLTGSYKWPYIDKTN